MNRKLFYENEEHGEALFIEVLSFIIPMDENTLRGKQENERKQVSKLLIINHDWYDVIKAGYYSRFHIYESIKQHYDDLDFELLIKYCIGEEYTKNVNFSKAKSFNDNSALLLAEKAPCIETLNVGGCFNVSDMSLKRFAKKLKCLKSFTITACTNNFSVRCIEHFIRSRGSYLIELNISKCKSFVDDALIFIVAKKCINLKILNVSSCNLGDLSCKYLADEKKGLNVLDLSRNIKIGDNGMIQLLEKIGINLKVIKIEGLMKLTEASFMEVSFRCKHLERLSLSECPGLKDPSLHTLTQTLPKLKWLDLRYCRNITRKAIKQLCFVQNEEPTIIP